MSDPVTVLLLGINNIGWHIYEHLNERKDTHVRGIVTELQQVPAFLQGGIDYLIMSGFEYKLPLEIIDAPEQGCLNLHPGYLPAGRGYYPNVWSIVEDLPAGATLHLVDEGIDTGEILERRRVEKLPTDTGKTLYYRIEAAAVDLFIETWPKIIRGEIQPVEQDEAEASWHTKDDFHNLCDLDSLEIDSTTQFVDVLRALTFPPFQNAYFTDDGKRYFVEVNIREETRINERTDDLPLDS